MSRRYSLPLLLLTPQNGILDLESTARMVLRDWNSGSIPYYTLPPKDPVNSSQNTQILSAWGQEFDLKDYDEAFVYDSMPAAFQNSMVMVSRLVTLANL